MKRSQIREIVRDVCTPCQINQIRAANLQLQRILGGHLVRIDNFGTLVFYTVYPADTDDYDIISFDFVSKQIA